MIRPAAALLILTVTAAAADAPRLAFPVDCTLRQDCFIQNHVDRDPGPRHADFGCGALSYDGHDGTDIALVDLHAMAAGVAVRAAAPGTVRATRDGMPDILATDPEAPDLANRACGNAVIVDHGGGWETRYCHLKRGSVAVATGDRVGTATVLGEVGLSGRTEFPHVHVALVRDGATVDPFQPEPGAACGDTAGALWTDDIPYAPGALISAGFAADVPAFGTVKAGDAHAASLAPDAPALVMWAQLFGAQAGDELAFVIEGPNRQFLDQTVTLDRTQARAFRAVGRNLRARGWAPGTYTGTVRYLRGGTEIGRLTATTVVTR